jgi:enoyl-CoA hydratase
MLQRAVGPQRTAAMVLLGEEVDGATAVEWGLALRCVERSQLLDAALTMAAGAVAVPRALVERVKATMSTLGAPDGDELERAAAIEAEAQEWSTRQDFFRDRIAAMRDRVAGSSSRPPAP